MVAIPAQKSMFASVYGCHLSKCMFFFTNWLSDISDDFSFYKFNSGILIGWPMSLFAKMSILCATEKSRIQT